MEGFWPLAACKRRVLSHCLFNKDLAGLTWLRHGRKKVLQNWSRSPKMGPVWLPKMTVEDFLLYFPPTEVTAV